MFGSIALRITLALTLAAGLGLGLVPQLDLAVSDLFVGAGPAFPWRFSASARLLRSLGMHLPVCVAMAAALALALRMALPRLPRFVDTRTLIAVLLAFLLGPGLLVNGVLKCHSGRERPLAVLEAVERGEASRFRPWWDFGGSCRSNCSFASGEVSAAAFLLAATALLPAMLRGIAAVIAFAFTAGVALLRIGFGGHFLSDVLLAALLTHLIAIAAMRLMHDEHRVPGGPGALDGWWRRRFRYGRVRKPAALVTWRTRGAGR